MFFFVLYLDDDTFLKFCQCSFYSENLLLFAHPWYNAGKWSCSKRMAVFQIFGNWRYVSCDPSFPCLFIYFLNSIKNSNIYEGELQAKVLSHTIWQHFSLSFVFFLINFLNNKLHGDLCTFLLTFYTFHVRVLIFSPNIQHIVSAKILGISNKEWWCLCFVFAITKQTSLF